MTLGPQSEKQAMMLNHNAQILVLGGAVGGMKTFSTCMIPLRYADCPFFNGIIFRRTTVQVKGQGGLWDTANDIFAMIPKEHRPKVREYDLTATWMNGENGTKGAKLKFSHMEYVKNKLDHQGLQYTFVGFDEGTHFEWEQVEYLMSRMRSKSKYPSRMVISCNPDPDSWLYEMVEWYLTEEGFPDKNKDGVMRWFIRRDGEFIWSTDKQKLIDEYSTEHKTVKPVSFSFISSTIYDNKICMENNPEYVDWLEGLNKIEQSRLLHGNWKVRPEGANYFKREDLVSVDKVPSGSICARGYDKASTEPHDINKYPDFTASSKQYKDRDGNIYLVGDYHRDGKDKDTEVYGKYRKKPGPRNQAILKQAIYDGNDCVIILPKDAGSAGDVEYTEHSKQLISEGFSVKKDPAVNGASKLTKFEPFSDAVAAGYVHIVENTFPNKATIESFLKDLESFDGGKSGKLKKDDIPDAVATTFNYLSQARNVPIVLRNQKSTPTIAKAVLEAR